MDVQINSLLLLITVMRVTAGPIRVHAPLSTSESVITSTRACKGGTASTSLSSYNTGGYLIRC